MNVVYAYALEAVEHEARVAGGSVLDARDDFHRKFAVASEEAKEDVSPAKVRDQALAQAALMGAMSRAGSARV